MNKLEEYLSKGTWRQDEAMDELQDIGLVSDCSVDPCDVADSDCEAAVKHLEDVRR